MTCVDFLTGILFTRVAPINKFFDLNIFRVDTDKLDFSIVAELCSPSIYLLRLWQIWQIER